MKVQNEINAEYNTNPITEVLAKTREENNIIDAALEILGRRIKKYEYAADSPHAVKAFLKLKMALLEHEVFCIIYLNSQNKIIDYEEMFRGGLSSTSVYPREVVKSALSKNAGGVILAHNHPSGLCVESKADRDITDHLKKALNLVDVRLLDHILIAGDETMSFSERGYI